jgi:hypothetical protein
MEKYTIERHKCFECGSDENIHYHHVVPKSKGGTRTLPLCSNCHSIVHDAPYLKNKKTKKKKPYYPPGGIEHKRLQLEGIKKAKENGVYANRIHHRRKETIDEFLNKHKDVINILKRKPNIKNIKLSEITGVHFNTITKIRKVVGIQKL